MEVDPTRICELLVGLPDVNVLGVIDAAGMPVRSVIETRGPRPACTRCAGAVLIKDRPEVELVDLAAFGRPARLVWRKHRWACANDSCGVGSWTGEDARIAPARAAMTDRAGRWVTRQVGEHGRTVNELAGELECAWHTVNDAVIAYGTALVDDDPDRIGDPTALGLDETLFVRVGPRHRQAFSTSIVDVRAGKLLDVVPGRSAVEPCRWLEARGSEWLANIAYATLDLSGPYRLVFDTMVPDAVQVADPFHVVKLANHKLDECRRRVQNETCGHRRTGSTPTDRESESDRHESSCRSATTHDRYRERSAPRASNPGSLEHDRRHTGVAPRAVTDPTLFAEPLSDLHELSFQTLHIGLTARLKPRQPRLQVTHLLRRHQPRDASAVLQHLSARWPVAARDSPSSPCDRAASAYSPPRDTDRPWPT